MIPALLAASLGLATAREAGLAFLAAIPAISAILGLTASSLELVWIVGHLTDTDEAGLDLDAPIPADWRPIYLDRLATLDRFAVERLDGAARAKLRTQLAEVRRRFDGAALGEIEGTLAYLEHAHLGADRVLWRYLLSATPLGLVSGLLGAGLDYADAAPSSPSSPDAADPSTTDPASTLTPGPAPSTAAPVSVLFGAAVALLLLSRRRARA